MLAKLIINNQQTVVAKEDTNTIGGGVCRAFVAILVGHLFIKRSPRSCLSNAAPSTNQVGGELCLQEAVTSRWALEGMRRAGGWSRQVRTARSPQELGRLLAAFEDQVQCVFLLLIIPPLNYGFPLSLRPNLLLTSLAFPSLACDQP